MDIEGSTFRVIDSLEDQTFKKIGQICIEVYDRLFENGYEMLQKMVKKYQRGFALISISDSYDEVTFQNVGISD